MQVLSGSDERNYSSEFLESKGVIHVLSYVHDLLSWIAQIFENR